MIPTNDAENDRPNSSYAHRIASPIAMTPAPPKIEIIFLNELPQECFLNSYFLVAIKFIEQNSRSKHFAKTIQFESSRIIFLLRAPTMLVRLAPLACRSGEVC